MKFKQYIVLYSILYILHFVQSVEKEITVNIEAGKEDCFYQSAKKGDVIDLEYQVIDGGHGDLDITFRLVDPTGRVLLADYKKSENNHRTEANMDGDYKFCFDNTFSSYNTKTVFFEMIVDDDESEWGSDNLDVAESDMIYKSELQAFEEIFNNIRNHLKKVRHFQDLSKSSEARDRNVAEENYFKVNTYSLFQLILMLVVGFIQVVMVKSLFDYQSRAHKIWKNLEKNIR